MPSAKFSGDQVDTRRGDVNGSIASYVVRHYPVYSALFLRRSTDCRGQAGAHTVNIHPPPMRDDHIFWTN